MNPEVVLAVVVVPATDLHLLKYHPWRRLNNEKTENLHLRFFGNGGINKVKQIVFL